MRESAQDFFLNTKARFQSSLDIEDAADLYFACYNLINHDIDFDWDSTLQKMENLLKEQDLDIESVQAQPKPKPQSLASKLRLEGVQEKPALPASRMKTDIFRNKSKRSTSSFEYAPYTSDTTPSRNFGTRPVNNDRYRQLTEIDPKTGKSLYQESLERGIVPLAFENYRDVIAALLSDRAVQTDDRNLPDEYASLNLFIDNHSSPKLFQHLLEFYYPKSEFYVGETDKDLAKHSRKITEENLPPRVREQAGKTKRLVYANKEEKKDAESALYAYQENIGHLNPEIIGELPSQMRYRLYQRRYAKWENEYSEKYPDSEYNEAQRRRLFVNHVALELDGVPPEKAWEVLYQPSGRMVTDGYLGIANTKGYSKMRDVSRQAGNYAYEHELLMLPFDEMVDFMHIYHQMSAYNHAQKFKHEDTGEALPIPAYLINKISKEVEEGKFDIDKDKLFFSDGDTFLSGAQGSGFTSEDIYRFAKQMRMVHNTAMHYGLTTPVDVAHNHNRPYLRHMDSNWVKKLYNRMLKEAHSKQIPRAFTGEDFSRKERLGKTGLYAKVKKYYQSDFGEDGSKRQWDDIYDIPNIKLDTMYDLFHEIESLSNKGILNKNDVIKAYDFLDKNHHGLGADSLEFLNLTGKNMKILDPFVFPVEGIDISEYNAADLPVTYKKNAFYPLLTRYTGKGGRGAEGQDTIANAALRYPHEMIAIPEERLEISDVRAFPEKKARESEDDFNARKKIYLDGLGMNEGQLGEEIERILDKHSPDEPALRTLLGNNEFPILSNYLQKIVDDNERPKLDELAQMNNETVAEGASDDDSQNMTRFQLMTVKGAIHNMVRFHTGMLIDPELSPASDKYNTRELQGSLENLIMRQTSEGHGSLGYIPATYSDFMQYLTTVPSETAPFFVAVNNAMPRDTFVKLDTLQPFLDSLPDNDRKEIMEHYEKIRQRQQKKLDVTEKQLPSSNIQRGGTELDALIADLSKKFFMAPNHLHTNHPYPATQMHLTHARKDAPINLRPGDGSIRETRVGEGASYATLQVAKRGKNQNLARLKDLQMRFRASLWGMAGTPPLHYPDGSLVLSNPKPFLEMLQKRENIDEHFFNHPSKFFEDSNMNNFFASLSQEGLVPSWREAITTNAASANISKYYKYPLIKRDGRYYLELSPFTKDSDGQTLFSPVNFVDGNIAQPVRTRELRGQNIMTLDTALFLGSEQYNASVDSEDNRKILRSQDLMPVPPHVTITKDGYAYGPHPSEFAAQWADLVFDHPSDQPSSSGLREAKEELMYYAQNRAMTDIGDSYNFPEERDILLRSGLKLGDVDLILKDEVTLFNGLRDVMPLMIADSAIQQYSDTDLSLDDMVSRYVDENLKIGYAHPQDREAVEETHRRRGVYHKLIEKGFDFMQGDSGHPRIPILKRLIGTVSESGNEKQWLEKIAKAGVKIYEDDDGTKKATYDYLSASSYLPHYFYSAKNFAANYSEDPNNPRLHPLTSLTSGKDRDVTGHEILSEYIHSKRGHPDVIKELRRLGINRVNTLLETIERLTSMHDDLPELSVQNSREAIQDAGHHVANEEPLQWFKAATENPDRRSGGKTNKEMKMVERGQYAQKSIALRNFFNSQLQHSSQTHELLSNLGPLLFSSADVDSSLMSRLKRDITYARDKHGNLAYPEHANTLSKYEDSLPVEEKLNILANFFHCRGKWANIKDSMDISRIEPGSFSMGDSHAEPGILNIKHSKYSTTLVNQSHKNNFGDSTGEGIHLHPAVHNLLVGDDYDSSPVAESDGSLINQQNYFQPPAAYSTVDDVLTSFDVLTDLDLIYKSDSSEGKPVPLKAMHRIFTLDDLDTFKGLSGDWVLSSWPKGERLIVSKKGKRVKAYNAEKDSISLPSVVRNGVKEAHKADFVIDTLWDGDVLHIVDIVQAADEDLGNTATKDRVRHLRANFSATEEVLIPAPINTKRVDTEGLERAVKDLMAEKGVKQVMLRDADSTYMRGETRHPKWLLLTKEHQIDVKILDTGGAAQLGIGPILDDDAKRLGNRAVKYDGEYYMDVGTLSKVGLEAGQCVTIKTSNVTSKSRDGLLVFTVHGAKYVKDAETNSADSVETLALLSGDKNQDVPHNVRVSKGSVHLEFPAGHVVYDTEQYGHSFMIKSVDAPNAYLETLAESQREYWEPVAAVLLRAEIETRKAKKANVVPEPPANHDKKPKKVLKPAERLLKDPVLAKQLMTALEALDDILKEKITFTGPKGLGIDFATPIESPSGPTKNTEEHNLPDHDPAHRQNKGGDCWCGAKIGEACNEGMGHTTQECPKFSPPSKEKDEKHIKIPI